MLKKILKYDLSSVGRIWWIIAVSVLGMTVFSSLMMRMVTEQMLVEHPFLMVIVMLLFVFNIFAIFASAFITMILVFWRFYKNFFTDEGYLTFTLPVSRKDLLFSKLLTSLVWNFASAILIVLCFFIMFALIPPENIFKEIFWAFDIAELSKVIFGPDVAFGIGWLLLYVVEAVLMITAYVVAFASLVFLCITLGAMIAKKAKLITGIGIYYGINVLFSSVAQIISMLFMSLMSSGLSVILVDAPISATCGAIALIMLIVCTMISAVAALLYFITLNCLERKLNLP